MPVTFLLSHSLFPSLTHTIPFVPLLLRRSDPFFPLSFLVNSWFPGTLDAFFQALFLCALLLFWLCVYHGIRVQVGGLLLPFGCERSHSCVKYCCLLNNLKYIIWSLYLVFRPHSHICWPLNSFVFCLLRRHYRCFPTYSFSEWGSDRGGGVSNDSSQTGRYVTCHGQMLVIEQKNNVNISNIYL